MVAVTAAVWAYKTTPGELGSPAPATWPEDLGLGRTAGRATLVMLAHPKCPCTRASVADLAVLMTHLGGAATGYVLFKTPPEAPEGWEHTDTWTNAAKIVGIRVLSDRGGAIAARLGATTSGHLVVYDEAGRLVFSGGITPGRGHAGDSAGQTRILSLLGGNSQAKRSAPTFGCELEDRRTAENTP